jgi:hypothetical protein
VDKKKSYIPGPGSYFSESIDNQSTLENKKVGNVTVFNNGPSCSIGTEKRNIFGIEIK